MINIKKLKKLCDILYELYHKDEVISVSSCGDKSIQLTSKAFLKAFNKYEVCENYYDGYDKLFKLIDGYEFFAVRER